MQKLLILSYVLFSWTILFAQNDTLVKYDKSDIVPVQFQKSDLDTYKNDSKFNYEEVKTESTWFTDVINWFYNLLRRFFEWIFGVGNAEGYLAVFLEILPYLLLALFLYLVIRFFVRSNIQGKGKKIRTPTWSHCRKMNTLLKMKILNN